MNVPERVSRRTAAGTLIGITAVMLSMDAALAVVALTVMPILALLTRLFSGKVRARWHRQKELESSVATVLQEVLSGLRVVKAFGQEQREEQRFLERAGHEVRASLSVVRAQVVFYTLTAMVLAIGTAAALWIGVRNVQAGALTLGQLTMVMAYLAQLYAPLEVLTGKVTELQRVDADVPEKLHFFRFINQAPLNGSRQDLLVNFLEYWQVDKNDRVTRFSWVTDLTITPENVEEIMRAGRARWKIENETFNTLKNQGYNLEHNYGLGKKHLSAVFAILMMLAFLVDQVQQMSCHLFQSALKELGSKRALWELMRNYFRMFRVDSMETIFRVLVYGPGGYIVLEKDWLG